MALLWSRVSAVFLLNVVLVPGQQIKRFALEPLHTGLPGAPAVFSATVIAGRNPRKQRLLVDTGSSVLVLASAAESPRSISFLGRDDGDGEATIQYEGGAVSGSARRSRICLAALLQDDGATPAADDADLCIDDFPVFRAETTDTGFAQLGLDGVLGLAPQPGAQRYGLPALDETLADGTAKAAGLPRAFGIFASPNAVVFGPSELALGGADTKKMAADSSLQFIDLAQPPSGRWELPLQELSFEPANGGPVSTLSPCGNSAGDCRALVDTGTTELEVAPGLQEQLLASLPDAVASDCSNLGQLPDLRISFQGGSSFVLGPEDYVQHMPSMGCTLAINPISAPQMARHQATVMVLGQPFLKRYYALFDQDNRKIGIAPSASSPGKTRNQRARESTVQQEFTSLQGFLGPAS